MIVTQSANMAKVKNGKCYVKTYSLESQDRYLAPIDAYDLCGACHYLNVNANITSP